MANKTTGQVDPLAPDAAITAHAPTVRTFTQLAKADADHPLFGLIGRVTANWAQFEHTLDLMIWDLSKHEQAVMACLTGQIMGAGPRFSCIKALATLRRIPHPLIERAEALMHRSFNHQEYRNRITHDVWLIDKGTGEPNRFKKMPRKDLDFGIRGEDVAAIEKLIADIGRLSDTALALRADILGALHPSA